MYVTLAIAEQLSDPVLPSPTSRILDKTRCLALVELRSVHKRETWTILPQGSSSRVDNNFCDSVCVCGAFGAAAGI